MTTTTIRQVRAAFVHTSSQCKLLLRKVHLYIALTVGFMFAFSGLTGSTLVFYQEIDTLLNPQLTTVTPAIQRASLTEIITAVTATMPKDARLVRLYLPKHPEAAMKLKFSVNQAGQVSSIDVMVNPYTTEVLGQRQWGGYLMSTIYKLHYTLLQGEVGKSLIGILGLLLLTVLLSGLYLWWPKAGVVSKAFSIKRGSRGIRFLYDIHRVVGVYAVVIIMVLAFTGTSMIFPQYIKPTVAMISSLTTTVSVKLPLEPPQPPSRLTLDEMQVIAQAQFPLATLQRIHFPKNIDEAYRFILRQPGEVRKGSGASQVWLSPYDGSVLQRQQPQTMSGGDHFLNWMFPLHNGEAFGLLGRLVVFITGFLLVGLYVTGVMMWWRKRR